MYTFVLQNRPMRNYIYILLVLAACTSNKNHPTLDAEVIVQRAIDSSGTHLFEKAKVSFHFRDKIYQSEPTCEGLILKREFISDSVLIQDELYSGKLKRYQDGLQIQLSDSLALVYAESVNSVHYFVQLPYRLNDYAVTKKWVGDENDNESKYHKLKVTFQEEGGGEDFEDVYYYWIDAESFRIAYLAYSFQVNDGGIRFREATEYVEVDGILFANYNNYKPELETAKVEDALQDFLNGDYQLLSTISSELISVNHLDLDCE